jgi:hypothetical protein
MTPSPSPIHAFGRAILGLFSSVRFGIWTLVALFIYMAIGSAGVLYPTHPNLLHPDAWVHAQIRQWRPFEMTEFEWFHWWPFNLMVLLICVNMAVVTVRRIPLRVVNLGVWMIHIGILVLAVGSLIYFGTKVEGDAPIIRRQVNLVWVGEVAENGARQTVTAAIAAMPGNRTSLETPAGRYDIEVVDIDPQWELLSGEDAGTRALSVSLLVMGPTGRFVRQVIDGYPQYTEDLIFGRDPEQPMQRARQVRGEPILDTALVADLEFKPQRWFYLKNELNTSFALYLRRPGELAWVERPIRGMPQYNDYIADRAWVFESEGTRVPIDPIDIPVPPVDPRDPAPDITFRVNGYLRYAVERSRLVPGRPDDPLNPTAFMTITSDRGERSDYRLQAFDPEGRRADGGLLAFHWINDEAELAPLLRQPTLRISIPAEEIEIEAPIRAVLLAQETLPFTPIDETGYSYRVVTVQDEIVLSTGTASIAIVELQTPSGRFRRWVFDDPQLTRDVDLDPAGVVHGVAAVRDDSIRVEYLPGTGMSLISLVAGPDPRRLRVINAIGPEEPELLPIEPGRTVEVPGGLQVVVTRYEPRAVIESKPWIVPPMQRERDAGTHFAMTRLEAPGTAGRWLRFHHYAFERPEEVLRRHRYQPELVTLADGSVVEVLFSRQRLPLPQEIALEDFVLTAHVGGFTGESGSIRNWTSMLRFETPQGWTAPKALSVNDPVEFGGLSYFQAQWDPPDAARFEGDRPSRGLNHTVLGVGNRNGVFIQLAGCTISVIGMIYAFYIKPVIRRRQLERAAAAAGDRRSTPASSPTPALAGAALRSGDVP